MSQIRGKQIKDQSVDLQKLSGTGSVTFLTGAGMTFNAGSNLYYTDAPTQGIEVANKAYVDSVASGLEVKEAARAIAVSPITLSGTQTIDGVALAAGDRVVVNGQSAASQNGIYVVASGSWTRAVDMNESVEVNGGEFVFIKEGNTYADTGWVISTPDGTITIGVGAINFTQFSSAGVIDAGLGLLQTGNTFDIITGVGLTASANELKLDDTSVTSGDYGSAGTVSTFTVDDQGRLTAAGDVTIDITASQVNNFSTAVNDEVFASANFVDSSSVDFDVTTGATVSADVKVNTATGLTVSASGVEINYGTGLTVSGNQLVVDSSTFGVQDADNGLSIDGSSNVVLGGTLSVDTTINGNTRDFTLNNANTITFATSDCFVSVGASYSLEFEQGFIADTSGTGHGIKYVTDYSTTFEPNSLITRKYVDTGTASLWTAINAITDSDIEQVVAGSGLTGGGTQGVVTVGVGDGAGIKVNANSIEVEITAQGGLTFSASGADGTLQVAYDSSTLGIVGGELTVLNTGAQPVYDIGSPDTTYEGANGAGATTNIEISQTPNDYSRIEVYVNGQRQLLGDQNTETDCWFGGDITALRLTDVAAEDKLVWNSQSAGFALETTDRVEIVYEA